MAELWREGDCGHMVEMRSDQTNKPCRKCEDQELALLREVEKAAHEVIAECLGYERGSYLWEKWGCEEILMGYRSAKQKLDALRSQKAGGGQ